jgi:type IV pilus assembly protein PilO
MANVPDARRKLRVVMAVLVGANVLLVCALGYMWFRGTSALPGQFNDLHQQVVNRRSAIVPPEKVGERVNEAREQIAKFYENRFANSSAAIFEDLGKIATANKVRLNNATYNVNDSDMPGLRMVEISANLDGDYTQTMKFINSLERDKTFFIVNSVSLGDQNGGHVRLAIRIETYIRGEA